MNFGEGGNFANDKGLLLRTSCAKTYTNFMLRNGRNDEKQFRNSQIGVFELSLGCFLPFL
jgi:hypothetical protein